MAEVMPEIMPEFTRLCRKYAHYARMYAQNLHSPNIMYDIQLRGTEPGLSRIMRVFGRDFFPGPATGQRAHTDYSVPHKSLFVKRKINLF